MKNFFWNIIWFFNIEINNYIWIIELFLNISLFCINNDLAEDWIDCIIIIIIDVNFIGTMLK